MKNRAVIKLKLLVMILSCCGSGFFYSLNAFDNFFKKLVLDDFRLIFVSFLAKFKVGQF